ncbi:hypothetical protein D9611_007740 [Ephemerocybe angulata]|uniref:Glutathione S-transferase n=1 Tax=Ephemerocybe angulata TaxID=980116 RepID=A0A8H5C0D2_9AGAR|nr:hypothetical protein D9611_007740 [Tulosesus angulatus]
MPTASNAVHAYTLATPNGVAIASYLEELKERYPGFAYDFTRINIWKGTQKEDWFLKLNPNGRIPVLVDKSRGDFVVFESSAILLYLAQHYDKDFAFWFSPESDLNSYSEIVQWLFFAHGGIGPMQGQNNHFNHDAPEKIPYAQKRYTDETKRLYGVLNIRLNGREYLAGDGKGRYSLADLKSYPWVKIHPYASIETLDEFPHVKAWLERCVGREASVSGAGVAPFGNFLEE